MRATFQRVAYFILLGYLIISCYTGFIIVKNKVWKEQIQQEKYRKMTELAEEDRAWNPWGEEFDNERTVLTRHEPPNIVWNLDQGREPPSSRVDNSKRLFNVEVWGKASIGLYLWQHILEGPLEERMEGVWSHGTKTINNIKFTFRTGPGVVPDQVPKETEHLLLVLNGREPDKITFAKSWLTSLDTLPRLQNVGLVLLGNEQCNNSWLHPYMAQNGGRVKFAFLVYDSPEIDNKFYYQWPLGVATYRDFPRVDSSKLPVHIKRKYSCNFLGTVYKNSSRETLMKILEGDFFRENCYVKPRYRWLPEENADSREEYIRLLSQSDLTLNPVGQNTECYRIYEAISYGSIPVIEDVRTPGICGKSETSEPQVFPLRLLKDHNAPVIFVKHWSELHDLIENEKTLLHSERVKRRRNVLLWYESFKSKMRKTITNVISTHFFGVDR
ncbi:ribitol-5-phosphate xylosyltransferase 1-like [Mya arenaria]|uniref:ribitol-5-phosphate xylosyltransferase 1-like n=1 Tax=Mya arenaria TaxID=6604 RepID=UPI0022E556A6|nr:ribitol-5-phosphate xylosyltransferase 1-like [Mya arenaria]